MDLSFIIRLIDQFTRPAAAVRQALDDLAKPVDVAPNAFDTGPASAFIVKVDEAAVAIDAAFDPSQPKAFDDAVDRAGTAVEQVSTRLGRLKTFIGEIRAGLVAAFKEGFSTANMDAAISQAETKLGQARGRLMGAIGFAAGLAAPVINLGSFESDLVAFGNTAGIFGDDLKAIEAELRVIGPQVNKTAGEMLSGLEYLVGKGLSPDEGIAAIRSVGMTATATGASIDDMSAAGYAVLSNLRVPAEDLQKAFDAMAQSGKAGGFELRDMAQFFPQLTAQARALGMEGVPAVAEMGAALQVALRGAGDPSQAANNMLNFMSKLASPDAVKSFAEAGVNLETEFARASENGISVMEHMLTVIGGLTEGNQFKLGELFGDQQVKGFLLPLIEDFEDFKRIRDESLSADGVNAADFARVMDTLGEKVKAAVIQLDNLSTSGSVLLEIAKDLATQIGSALAAVNAFAQANPELTRTLVLVAAGMMAMSIAARVATFALAGTRLGVLNLLNLFLRFDEAGKNVAIGWRILAGAGSLLSGTFGVIKVAAGFAVSALAGITAPVWAVIAVLAAAGFTLWKYWDRISSFVSGMAEGLGNLLGPAIDAVAGMIDGLITKLGELLGLDAAEMESFKAGIAEGFTAAFSSLGGIIDGAKQLMGDFWTWLTGFFSQEQLSDDEKAAMKDAGRKLIEDMWTGIQEKFQEVLDWFGSLGDQIKAAISSIDLSSIIQWPEPPEWLSWMFGGDSPPETPPPPSEGPPTGQDQAALRRSLGVPDQIDWNQVPEINGPIVGPEIQQTISAEVIDKRPPQVNVEVSAPVTVNGSGNPVATGNAVSNAISNEIAQATSGALHGGGE